MEFSHGKACRAAAICLTLLLFACKPLLAANPVSHLLSADQAPEGVVFEVVENDEEALQWAMPRIRDYIQRLRARFPNLDVAVVTHGREEFSLQTKHQQDYPSIHSNVRELVAEQQVSIHVCGTHAGWYGVSEDDFPDYVDVVPAGPVQIRQYQELGYEVIRIGEED